MKNILVGLHFRKHDANISIYDGKEFYYLLIEREEKAEKRAAFTKIDGDDFFLRYPSNSFTLILKKIFTKYNLEIENIRSIAVGDSHWYFDATNQKYEKTNWFSDICKDVYFVSQSRSTEVFKVSFIVLFLKMVE